MSHRHARGVAWARIECIVVVETSLFIIAIDYALCKSTTTATSVTSTRSTTHPPGTPPPSARQGCPLAGMTSRGQVAAWPTGWHSLVF